MGRDDQIMRCRICNSDEHFAARCTQRGGSSGSGLSAPPSNLVLAPQPDQGPLTTLLSAASSSGASSSQQHARHFMTQQGSDPLMGNDPWSNGSAAASASHRPVRGDKG